MVEKLNEMKRAFSIFPFAFFLLLSTQLPAQIQQFQGNWTKLGTTYNFEFDLQIRHTDGNAVEGVFHWRVVNYDENEPASKAYYEEKIGLTAKEFVRGTYNPKSGEFLLKGYKKEDPNLIIGIDDYKIKMDENGDIGGDTKAAGTWLGRINGKEVKADSA